MGYQVSGTNLHWKGVGPHAATLWIENEETKKRTLLGSIINVWDNSWMAVDETEVKAGGVSHVVAKAQTKDQAVSALIEHLRNQKII